MYYNAIETFLHQSLYISLYTYTALLIIKQFVLKERWIENWNEKDRETNNNINIEYKKEIDN